MLSLSAYRNLENYTKNLFYQSSFKTPFNTDKQISLNE